MTFMVLCGWLAALCLSKTVRVLTILYLVYRVAFDGEWPG